MTLTAAREELLAPLQSVIGVVERRQTMLVLANANVLLAAPDNKLNVTGTDLEVELVATCTVRVRPPGDITAPGRGHRRKHSACELGGNRLAQVQVNVPARRWYPGELRLRPSLRGQAAVPATRRE